MAKQIPPVNPDHPSAVYSSPTVAPRLARAQFGQTSFQVNYDPSLGGGVGQLATAVWQTADGDLAKLVNLFAAQPQQVPFTINLSPVDMNQQPLSGAVHDANGGTVIWVNPINPETKQLDADWARMLVVAEVVEDFEYWQNGGWDLVHTNGEGLSRVLASAIYPNVIPASRAALVNAYMQAGMPDCINDNSRPDAMPGNFPTEADIGNGGAVLFLNWLTTQLGYDWDQVVQAPAPTLSGTYKRLQGRNDAYQRFVADLQLFPSGQFSTDNPFPVFPAHLNVQTRVNVARMTGPWNFPLLSPGVEPE